VLSLEPLSGASIEPNSFLGSYPTQRTSWGTVVNMGSLQYEQSKSIVFRLKLPNNGTPMPYLRATLKYETKSSDKPFESVVEGNSWDPSLALELEAQRHRLTAVDCIQEAMKQMKATDSKAAQAVVKKLIKEISDSKTAQSDKRVKALLEDLQGQVMEALSRNDWYTKWGAHYLPSLTNAHLLQICNNFKDPGVQVYGGKLFQQLRDRADDIFVKLPPPKPSCNTSAPPVASMGAYHSSGNPCFHGTCVVQMADGSLKKVNQISRGDRVVTPAITAAEVVCVVKTVCPQGTAQLVELPGGLLVTPYHPVLVDGKWQFPCDLGETRERSCNAVYSFVLSEGHTMIINGVPCVSLGHSFQGDVVQHPYFGSQKVVEDLKVMQGWNSGFVQLQTGCMVRADNSSLVCSLKQSLSV